MNQIINITKVPTGNLLKDRTIKGVRFISKSRAGFLTICDGRDYDLKMYNEHPETLISMFKKGALQTTEVQIEGSDYWFTVFARAGKKVYLIDEAILEDLTVGTINAYFNNTNLYNQAQYNEVNAATWASKAYVMNEPKFDTVRVA